MIFSNPRQMKRLCEAASSDAARTGGPNRFLVDLDQAVRSKESRPGNDELSGVSIRGLFEAFVPHGAELLNLWSDKKSGGMTHSASLLEAGNAVSTSDFSNITGQLTYSAVLNGWELPGLIGDSLMTTVSSNIQDEEIVPGISGIGDEAAVVDEGRSYPLAGVSEEYITIARKRKRGYIVPVTKEAVLFDKTGLVIQRASAVGEWLAVNKEKRQLNTALGIDTSYRRNGAAAIATYDNSAGGFDNLTTENLQDETDIDIADLLMSALSDPNTGEPIVVQKPQLVVPYAKRRTAFRTLNATEVRSTEGTDLEMIARASLESNIQLVTNPYVKRTTGSDIVWFYGDFKKAFSYYEIWPITVEQAPTNADAAFSQDIVSQFKVSEMGVPCVVEPRYVVKSTGATDS